MEKLDNKEELIINCIMQNPRILLADIPDELNASGKENAISYPTVQRRVQKMTDRRILNRGYIIDWAKAGYVFRYKISIWVDHEALKDIARAEVPGSLEGKKSRKEKDLSIEEKRDLIYQQYMRTPGNYEENNEINLQIRLAHYIRTVLPEQDRFKDKLVVNDVFVLLGGGYGDLEALLYSKHDRVCMEFIINGLRNLKGIRDTTSAKLGFSSRYGWLGDNHNDEK